MEKTVTISLDEYNEMLAQLENKKDGEIEVRTTSFDQYFNRHEYVCYMTESDAIKKLQDQNIAIEKVRRDDLQKHLDFKKAEGLKSASILTKLCCLQAHIETWGITDLIFRKKELLSLVKSAIKEI